MTLTIRRATATNWPYRLVEPKDLRPGLEVMYIEGSLSVDSSVNPTLCGWRIVVDEVREVDMPEGKAPYVFYHFIHPQSWGEGGVPLNSFTEQFKRRPFDSEPHYWLPINPEDQR
jgi:hypothetical protein